MTQHTPLWLFSHFLIDQEKKQPKITHEIKLTKFHLCLGYDYIKRGAKGGSVFSDHVLDLSTLLLQRGGLADLSARGAEIQPCPLICGLGPFQVMTRASRGSCREIPPFAISQANTAGRIRSRFQPRDGGRGRGREIQK